MNFVTSAEALRTYVIAQWALTAYATVPIYQDNRLATETPNQPWIRMTVSPLDRRAVAFGNTRIWRTYGQIVFQLFIPIGDGDGTARRYADVFIGMLEGKIISGIEVNAGTYRPNVGDEVNWAQYNVRFEYTVDEIK